MKLQNFLGVNLLVRLKNPVFWVQILLALFMPILTYFGRDYSSLTTWGTLFSLIGEAVRNPVVVAAMLVSAWNAFNDPTTAGLKDSNLAKTYESPKKEEE